MEERTDAMVSRNPVGQYSLAADVTKGLVGDSFWWPVPNPSFTSGIIPFHFQFIWFYGANPLLSPRNGQRTKCLWLQ